jgi:hypothetical protein
LYGDNNFPDKFNLWVGGIVDLTNAKGMSIWAKPSENAIDFQGETISGIYDQAIRLNHLGGNVELAIANGTTVAGDVIADTIDAIDATFNTCLVDNSPVRTFANSGGGDGMTYPPTGIAVSGGDHWEDMSIDPDTVAYLNTANSGNLTASGDLTGATLKVIGDKSASGITAPATGAAMIAWNARNSGETNFVNTKGALDGGFTRGTTSRQEGK